MTGIIDAPQFSDVFLMWLVCLAFVFLADDTHLVLRRHLVAGLQIAGFDHRQDAA